MLALENADEILEMLDHFTKQKPNEIPPELDEYIGYVAKTGDSVYSWSSIQYLFREKLLSVIKDFHDTTSSVEELPPCPNVDQFNYEAMKTLLFTRFDRFQAAPFTIQRLSELLVHPKKHYTRLDKFMRALEKNILVVSTVEPGRPPVDLEENGEENGPIAVDLVMESEPNLASLAKLDSEAPNGITNHTSNVDVEAIDESPSSSGVSDPLKHVSPVVATHAAANKNDDADNNVAKSTDPTEDSILDTAKTTESAVSFVHQACYETISNDSVDNTELDLSSDPLLSKNAANDVSESKGTVATGDKLDEQSTTSEQDNEIDSSIKDDDEVAVVVAIGSDEIPAVKSITNAADGNVCEGNVVDMSNRNECSEDIKTERGVDIQQEIESDIESRLLANDEAASADKPEEVMNKDAALSIEPNVGGSSKLDEFCNQDAAIESTIDADRSTKDETATKPFTPKRSRDVEADEYDAKKIKSSVGGIAEVQDVSSATEKQQPPEETDETVKDKAMEKADWETASLEEYIPPHITKKPDNAIADSTPDENEPTGGIVDESTPNQMDPAPVEVVSDAFVNESNEAEATASETIEDTMNEESTPAAVSTVDEMNVEEADGSLNYQSGKHMRTKQTAIHKLNYYTN